MRSNSRVLGRILRMPQQHQVRERLNQKLDEYQRRREHYLRKHKVPGYGVIIGDDKTLLDTHYKEKLIKALLENDEVRVGKVYQAIKKEFRGYIDDGLFHNAIQVLSDYLRTGGSNTSGGTGFMDERLFREMLADEFEIEMPQDPRRARQLIRKYHEYLGRVMDHELHPELKANEMSIIRDNYKARIIELLREHRHIDVRDLVESLQTDPDVPFYMQQFMQAVTVVRSYCEGYEESLHGGTGLH